MNMGETLRTVSDDKKNKRRVWTYGDHRRSVLFLELPEPTSVYDARYNIAHVERLPQIRAHDSVKFLRGI